MPLRASYLPVQRGVYFPMTQRIDIESIRATLNLLDSEYKNKKPSILKLKILIPLVMISFLSGAGLVIMFLFLMKFKL